MAEKDEKLDRLCILYEKLDDKGKGKLIRLGEELLNSENIFADDFSISNEKNGNAEI